MKTKLVWALIIAVVCSASFFALGYRQGRSDEHKAALRFNLNSALKLYSSVENGDQKRLTNDLGMLVYGFTQHYKETFGTNEISEDFRPRFAQAERISASVRSNLVLIAPY